MPRLRCLRRLAQSDDAVLDLPLKLTITAIVLAIAVPATWTTATSFARSDAETQAAAALAHLEAAARQVLAAGVGTRIVADVDLSGNAIAVVEEVRVGDDLATSLATGSIMRFKVEGRGIQERATDPPVHFQLDGGGPILLGPGTYRLGLTHDTGAYGGHTSFNYVKVEILET